MKQKLVVRWNTELVIACLFLAPQINYYLANLMDMYGLGTVTPFVYLVAYILGIMSYGRTLQTARGLLYTLTFVMSLIVSALGNSQVTSYMFNANYIQSSVVVLGFIYFPMFLLLLTRINFSQLMKYLWKGSQIVLVLAITVFSCLLFLKNSRTIDYMSFAYMTLSPVMICFIEGWEKNRVSLVLPIFASFILFVIGCRGAVVAIAVFLLLCFLKFYFMDGKQVRHLPLKILLLVCVLFVGVNMNAILKQLVELLNVFGFSSRTVEKLLLGNGLFIQSEGRMSIWRQALENIGVFGKGLFGDRTVLLDEYHNPIYPHNLILELMVDFGMILGPILVLAFFVIIVRAVMTSIKSGDPQKIQMAFAMLAVLLVKHMVSASFLTSLDFWFYIGLALNWIQYCDGYDQYEKEYGMEKSI